MPEWLEFEKNDCLHNIRLPQKYGKKQKKCFLDYKSGKTQSGQNKFANFISNKNSVYFSVYYLLFLDQISQSYRCPKESFLGLFWSTFSMGMLVRASQNYDTKTLVICYNDLFFEKK